MPREVEPHNTALVPTADSMPGFPVVVGGTDPRPFELQLEGAVRRALDVKPEPAAPRSRSAAPLAAPNAQALPTHRTTPFPCLYLRSRPKRIGTRSSSQAGCGSRRVCTRRRSYAMVDNRIASRRASPTLGRFGGFFCPSAPGTYASAEDRWVFRAEFGGGVLPMRKRLAEALGRVPRGGVAGRRVGHRRSAVGSGCETNL